MYLLILYIHIYVCNPGTVVALLIEQLSLQDVDISECAFEGAVTCII